MNISKTIGVNWENAISLKNTLSNEREELKKIEEQAREQIKNNPVDKFEKEPSATPVKLTATVVQLHNREKFDFIVGIDELSIDEKRTIMNLIEEATKKASGGNGDYFQMERAQTGIQLQLIAEKLIPEKYQEQMQQAIKDYQEEEFNNAKSSYEQMIVKFEKDESPLGAKMLARFKESLPKFIEQEQKMSGLYHELNLSNPSKFVESFENVLTHLKNEQMKSFASNNSIQADQEALRTKWNNFVSKFPEIQSFQLPTTQNAAYNFSI